MRSAEAPVLRNKHVAVIASCFLVVLVTYFFRLGQINQSSTALRQACSGSEAFLVPRSEGYVQDFVERLSKEARAEESSAEVYSRIDSYAYYTACASLMVHIAQRMWLWVACGWRAQLSCPLEEPVCKFFVCLASRLE